MEILSVEDAAKKIRSYLSRDTLRPYFVIDDGATDFKELTADLETIYISDFCAGDCLLNTDLLADELNTSTSAALVRGLGEYIYLTGQENLLRSLQDKNFNRKVIFVCRGIANLLEGLADEDFKFRANHICRVEGRATIQVVKYSSEINFSTDAQNLSELIKLLESGKSFATVQTAFELVNVKAINNFYDAIREREPDLTAPPDALDAEQWREYFFNDNCAGYPPEHWRSFAAGFKNQIANPYLRCVFERSRTYETYQKNLFMALLEVKDEKLFADFYTLRKAAVKNISSPRVEEYIEQLESFPDAVKYLTDNTAQERRAMIKAVQGKQTVPGVFKKNYSAMNDYLSDCDFGDATITNYFRRYKKIKLCNVEDEAFKAHVQELALTRPYNRFETRQKILEGADPTAKLYWLDALGVEFVSYIAARASTLGLAATIKIARADLPTLTAFNKNFYEAWRGDKFDKNQRLDDLKHSPAKDSAPTYIDDELRIIDGVLEEVKTSLTNHQAEKIILTSDHGASRLAVMFGRENKFKMTSCGLHGGRCCPINETDDKPTCATAENGWWVLANYDRFSGGRLGSVEIHGGATLEEVLVPVIEFSLQGAAVEVPKPLKELDDGFDFFD